MISFEEHGRSFNYRAAAIIIHDGYVLLHRAEHEDFWSLPGGRVEIGETAATTVRREMQEELGIEVQIERLVWVMEIFFKDGGRLMHELGQYFLVTLPPDAPLYQQREPFEGDEQGLRLIFWWAALESVHQLALYPIVLRQGLQRLPATVEHVVHHEF